MCNVPPKFYQVCRLCLSCPNSQCTDRNVNLSIFENDVEHCSKENTSIPHKIMTCLSILVGDSTFLRLIPTFTQLRVINLLFWDVFRVLVDGSAAAGSRKYVAITSLDHPVLPISHPDVVFCVEMHVFNFSHHLRCVGCMTALCVILSCRPVELLSSVMV